MTKLLPHEAEHVAYWLNASSVEVDADGDAWAVLPGGSRWLTEDEKVAFLEWYRERIESWLRLSPRAREAGRLYDRLPPDQQAEVLRELGILRGEVARD